MARGRRSKIRRALLTPRSVKTVSGAQPPHKAHPPRASIHKAGSRALTPDMAGLEAVVWDFGARDSPEQPATGGHLTVGPPTDPEGTIGDMSKPRLGNRTTARLFQTSSVAFGKPYCTYPAELPSSSPFLFLLSKPHSSLSLISVVRKFLHLKLWLFAGPSSTWRW